MKQNKILVALMSMTFVLSVVVGTAATVQADPPLNSSCSQLCSDAGDLGVAHGECVSFCTSCTNNGNTGANCTCNFLELIGALDSFFKNYGQCIKALK